MLPAFCFNVDVSVLGPFFIFYIVVSALVLLPLHAHIVDGDIHRILRAGFRGFHQLLPFDLVAIILSEIILLNLLIERIISCGTGAGRGFRL